MCTLPHTRCPTAMVTDTFNKRSEVREFRLGGKFLVKPASRLGRFMVTNGFFHSEEHPEKIEYIELVANDLETQLQNIRMELQKGQRLNKRMFWLFIFLLRNGKRRQ
jgi:hypothetical protein